MNVNHWQTLYMNCYLCAYVHLYIWLHVLTLLGFFSAWSYWDPQCHLHVSLLSKLSLVLPEHSKGISHCVLDSAQSAALDLPEGSLFAAASATGILWGRAFFPWSLECSFVWPNHFLAEHSTVLVKAAIVNTERRQVDRVSINVKLQKPLNPLETQWLFLIFFPRTTSGLI